MSRTDVHKPYRVKQDDPWWRHAFVEQHDHSTGPCDLDHHDPDRWQESRCHISWRNIGRNIHCGCWMCTGQTGRRLARSQERVAWRSLRQSIIAGVDRTDVDVPPLHGSAW